MPSESKTSLDRETHFFPQELQLRHRGLAQGECIDKSACPGEIEERLRDSTSGSPAEDGSTSGVSSGEPDETDRRETRDDIDIRHEEQVFFTLFYS